MNQSENEILRVYARLSVDQVAVKARTSLSVIEEDTDAEVKGEVSIIDREVVEYDKTDPVSIGQIFVVSES